MKIGLRLGLSFAVLTALMIVIGITAYTRLNEVNGQLTDTVEDKYPKTIKVYEIIEDVNNIARRIRNLVIYQDPQTRQLQYDEALKEAGHIAENMTYLEKTITSDKGKELLAKVQSARQNYVKYQKIGLDSGLAGKYEFTSNFIQTDLRDFQLQYTDALAEILVYQDQLMKDAGTQATESVNFGITLILILSGIGILFAIGIAVFVTRSITKPVGAAIEAADEIARGNMDVELDTTKTDEIGSLMRAMNDMAENIKTVVSDINGLAKAAQNGELDRRADAEKHEGEYKNLVQGINGTLDAVIAPLNVTAEYVDRISKGDIPSKITDAYRGDFNEIKNNINQLIDNLNQFIKDMGNMSSEHDRGDIDVVMDESAFIGAYKAMAKGVNDMVGGHISMNNKAMACVEEFGKGNFDAELEQFPGKKAFINRTIEKVRGNLKEFIKQMNNMSKEHDLGDIDVMINVDDFDGEFKSMAQGVNDMVNGHITVKKKAMACIKEFGNGNFDAEIEKFPGKKAFIHETIEAVRENLKSLQSDVQNLIQDSKDGKLSNRADATKFEGDWKALVQGINEMLDAVINPIKETVKVLNQMAQGKLSVKVKGEYKGDHAALKNAINTTVDLMPFKEAISVLKAMSDGDLTTLMKRDYKGDALEMKNAVNTTIESISEILGHVKTTVDEVTRGSMQVSDASSSLSQGATEQASSLEEITSSMAQIGSQTKMNAENANQANTLTNEARAAADKGNKEMDQLNKAMMDISESSKNISKIIKVIDEIAFQTNLLALNAAVEAARAGRHGKGFAVVAEEVRNLAARSATAAKETSELIENSIKTVENGSELAERTGEALEEIRSQAIKAADIVGEIATSSNEQAQGISQINEGLSQIDKVTQTNTSSAEESASAAEELSGQANQLKSLIARFKIKETVYDSYDDKDYDDDEDMMIAETRPRSKALPKAKDEDDKGKEDYNYDEGDELNPEDVIKLDEDNFGKY